MSKIIFVPLTDEMVFERPELITGPITTYRSSISKNCRRAYRSKASLQESRAYLKGDLLNGLDVVYSGDQPTQIIKAKKYRGFKRGI